LSKNYIYFKQKRNKDTHELIDEYKIIKKGKYKKRDKSWLASAFPIEVITKLFYEGEDAAIEYAKGIREQIKNNELPLEKVQKTVLVAANWKEFPENGFPVGSKPTIHYVWRGQYQGIRSNKKVHLPSDNPNESYSADYYIDEFDEIMKELPIELPKTEGQMMLSLF